MKQPISVTVEREHGNSGDVIITMTDARGDTHKLAVPGDCSSYQAFATFRGFFERELNAWFEPKDGVPFIVLDPKTGDASIMVDGVEVDRVADPVAKREAIRLAATPPTEPPPAGEHVS